MGRAQCVEAHEWATPARYRCPHPARNAPGETWRRVRQRQAHHEDWPYHHSCTETASWQGCACVVVHMLARNQHEVSGTWHAPPSSHATATCVHHRCSVEWHGLLHTCMARAAGPVAAPCLRGWAQGTTLPAAPSAEECCKQGSSPAAQRQAVTRWQSNIPPALPHNVTP
jgi:hypothetical protein